MNQYAMLMILERAGFLYVVQTTVSKSAIPHNAQTREREREGGREGKDNSKSAIPHNVQTRERERDRKGERERERGKERERER